MQLICPTEISLLFNIIPRHNDAFLTFWHGLQHSVAALIGLLHSLSLTMSHFHFRTSVESATSPTVATAVQLQNSCLTCAVCRCRMHRNGQYTGTHQHTVCWDMTPWRLVNSYRHFCRPPYYDNSFPEHGGTKLPRNVGKHLQIYMTSNPRRLFIFESGVTISRLARATI